MPTDRDYIEHLEHQAARLSKQLATVRQWMSQHALEPGCAEHVAELSSAMTWAEPPTSSPPRVPQGWSPNPGGTCAAPPTAPHQELEEHPTVVKLQRKLDNARAQLATVFKWMSNHASESGCAEYVDELSSILTRGASAHPEHGPVSGQRQVRDQIRVLDDAAGVLDQRVQALEGEAHSSGEHEPQCERLSDRLDGAIHRISTLERWAATVASATFKLQVTSHG